MPERFSDLSGAWTLYLLFLFLFTSLAAAGTISPSSGAASTSASAIPPANQRSVRSAALLHPTGSDEEGKERGDCSLDFVENFFRLLSGPLGKEAEALVAAVVKLLSENDRVNWLTLAEESDAAQQELSARDQHSRGDDDDHLFLSLKRGGVYGGGSGLRSAKRMGPKFNPTGWRRKRSVGAARESLGRFLQGFLESHRAARMQPPTPASSNLQELAADVSGRAVEEAEGWKNSKRGGWRRMYRRLPQQLKPKRKPLEFNPTGW